MALTKSENNLIIYLRSIPVMGVIFKLKIRYDIGFHFGGGLFHVYKE